MFEYESHWLCSIVSLHVPYLLKELLDVTLSTCKASFHVQLVYKAMVHRICCPHMMTQIWWFLVVPMLYLVVWMATQTLEVVLMWRAVQLAHGVRFQIVSQVHKWQRFHQLVDQHARTRTAYWLFQMVMRATWMVSCFRLRIRLHQDHSLTIDVYHLILWAVTHASHVQVELGQHNLCVWVGLKNELDSKFYNFFRS